MNHSSNPRWPQTSAGNFLATVWPASLPNDSELQRRKKLAVRAAQLAVVAMVAAAVGGAIVSDFRELSPLQIAVIIGAGLLYAGWCLCGMGKPVRLLWDQDIDAPVQWTPVVTARAVFYFAVQLGLAGLVFALGGRDGRLAWLVLLPPIAHSVILLPRAGIAGVSLASMAIFVFNIAWRHGWEHVAEAAIAFSFAVLFTLVFTVLAVSAERSRGKAQNLADELARANRKLREYAVQAEELAATRERNRLAREIHDSLGHYLTVVNVQIKAALAVQERDPARARDALDKAQALTQEGLNDIRRSVAALRASPLDNQSLVDALQQMADGSRASGLVLEMQVLGEARELSPATELTLYRAGQEGLTNVRKHAGTSSARLTLDFSQTAKVRLSVSDNGAGAAAGSETSGCFGLLGLRERAQLLGGEVRVKTVAGAGFTLEIEVPA